MKGIRRGLKLRTLYAKIADAGLEFPEEETTEEKATEETATETTETATEETASGFVTDEEKIEALREKIIATATATVNPEGLTPATLRQRVLDEVVEVSKRAKAAFLKNTMNKRLHIFWKAARLAVQTV